MSRCRRFLDDRLYPGVDGRWDDRLFRSRVLQYFTDRKMLLDLGAGTGIVAEMNFRGVAANVCGVDPDTRVLQNPYLDDARMATRERIPYPDETFDVVVADNMLEHLQSPEAVCDSPLGRDLRWSP